MQPLQANTAYVFSSFDVADRNVTLVGSEGTGTSGVRAPPFALQLANVRNAGIAVLQQSRFGSRPLFTIRAGSALTLRNVALAGSSETLLELFGGSIALDGVRCELEQGCFTSQVRADERWNFLTILVFLFSSFFRG